jgi:hypothetical protein
MDTVIILGAGHFGIRAAKLLTRAHGPPVWIVDKDQDSLLKTEGLPLKTILSDGISFLSNYFHWLSPANTIVPAIPVHVAFEWLKVQLQPDFLTRLIQVPGKLKSFLPHTWLGADGSLLTSYADFRCPDDCPEPANYCAKTKKARPAPLYRLLGQQDIPGYELHVIRSRQLSPGVGGYRVEDLSQLLFRVKKHGVGRWIVATACRCHGIMTCLEIAKRRTAGEA